MNWINQNIFWFSSAGIGRTGTFIAIDALYENGKKVGHVNIMEYIQMARKDRINMVQTHVGNIVVERSLTHFVLNQQKAFIINQSLLNWTNSLVLFTSRWILTWIDDFIVDIYLWKTQSFITDQTKLSCHLLTPNHYVCISFEKNLSNDSLLESVEYYMYIMIWFIKWLCWVIHR